MKFLVTIYPHLLGNPLDSFVLGEVQAKSRAEVVEFLESPCGNDRFVPEDCDYDIERVKTTRRRKVASTS